MFDPVGARTYTTRSLMQTPWRMPMLVLKNILEMGQSLLHSDEIRKDSRTSHIQSLKQSEEILIHCWHY